jgi:uncharacterized membrane protein
VVQAEHVRRVALVRERGELDRHLRRIRARYAIFPANVQMAVDAERCRRIQEPRLWLRLPLQALLIAWAWRVAVKRG